MTAMTTEGLLPCPDEPEVFAFSVGDPVSKTSGYAFDGTVRSTFHNRAGYARYVVEHSTIKGMLHIYSRKQLAPRAPSTGAGAEAREILAARELAVIDQHRIQAGEARIRRLEAAIQAMAAAVRPLRAQGEDRVWRPVDRALKIADDAILDHVATLADRGTEG